MIARIALGASFWLCTTTALAASDDAHHALARDIFRELIEINTTDSVGNTTLAAEAMAKRLRDGGFAEADIQVLGPNERKKNLVARLHGTGRHKPLLLIGHLDVVEARPEDWTTDPFKFIEKDGYFYGRGTQDMKDGDAIMVATFMRLKREGYRPDRDIVLALTADEEGGASNGVDWLLTNQRALVDAEFVLNHDSFSVLTAQGKPMVYQLDATEKVYADFRFAVTNPGGHSSIPGTDNAIYQLAQALTRLERHVFPFELNGVTRAYYERVAKTDAAQAADIRAMLAPSPDMAAVERLSRDRLQNAKLRTTCVATRLDAGHANNALPQRARATVNCRILPGHSPEEVRQVLIGVVADPRITVSFVGNDGSDAAAAPDRRAHTPPPVPPLLLKPLERLVAKMWPGIQILPDMSPGASDAVFTTAAGLPTYVITGVAIDRDNLRAHGRDERIGVDSFYRGVDFYYEYLKAVTTGK